MGHGLVPSYREKRKRAIRVMAIRIAAPVRNQLVSMSMGGPLYENGPP